MSEDVKKRGRQVEFDPVYVRDVSLESLKAFLLARPDVLLANCKRDPLYVDKLRDKAVFRDSSTRSFLSADAATPPDYSNRDDRVRYLFTLAINGEDEAKLIEWSKKKDRATAEVWKQELVKMKNVSQGKPMRESYESIKLAKLRVDKGLLLKVTAPPIVDRIMVDDFL